MNNVPKPYPSEEAFSIALVHDALMCRAGGERVALAFHRAFPDAPLYTLCYRPALTFPEFKDCDVRTSALQPLARTDKLMKWLFFPLGIWAMQQHDLTAYDVVLMSSTHCSKYVKLKPNALVINYCHHPFRLAWYPDSYQQVAESSWFKRRLFGWVTKQLQKIDYKTAQRVDYFLTNATAIKHKIEATYRPKKPVTVINPPVELSKYNISDAPKDYYLVVSRMEYYKKVDLVIEAFNQNGKPLLVVGTGTKAQEIKSLAKNNISFLSEIDDVQLAQAYANCKALIFPQIEDYGIVPLEAIASGRPVIAFGQGGILETMIPYKGDASKATALFFEEQSVASLNAAIAQFETLDFNPQLIRSHSEKFQEKYFIEAIQTFVRAAATAYKQP
jgi:glycosyltransferase involved in cell wall biosynthesis